MEGCDGRGHGVGRHGRPGTTHTQQQKPFVIVIMEDVSSRDTDVPSQLLYSWTRRFKLFVTVSQLLRFADSIIKR